MKTTKYIFLALLAALLLVPTSGRAETNTLKLVVDPTATILGLDCSDPTNQATILNLLFDASTVTEYTGSGKTVDDDGTKYVFELTTNGDNDIVPTGITEAITLATGANYASPTFRGTYKGEKITITIDKNGGDGAEHTVMITGYTNSYVLTIDFDPIQTSATEQNAGLKVTGGSTGTSEYTSSSTPSITDLFDVTGSIVATSTDDAMRVITLDGKQGQIYHGKSISLIWSPTTQVKLPVYDWDGNTTGVISNEADYTKSVAAGNPLTIPFIFNSAYYGKLATFTFTNDYDAGTTYIPSAQSFDVATNTWTFTLPDAARAMISKATFTVTKRPLTDANVTAALSGYTSKEGDVYIYEYTGADITPTIVLKDIERSYYDLVLTTDYTTTGDVTKKDPGLYTITLSGAGHNYIGDRTIQWRILKNINHSDFTVEVNNVTYTGSEFDLDAVKSNVVVKHNGTELVEGTDYDLTLKTGHQPFIKAKTYVEEIVITGKPAAGIMGTRYADFTIDPKNISTCDVTAEAAYDSGNPIDPSKNDGATPPTYDFITVKDGATTLVATTDFTVDVKADTYADAKIYDDAITITAVPGGNYIGSKVVDFTITGGTSINASTITVTVDPVVYKGAAFALADVKGLVTVKDGASTLTEGTHYDLAILTADNKNAKTYVNDIVITGKGTYYGTRNADFTVTPKDIALCTVTAEAAYTGSVIDPAEVDASEYKFVKVKDGATSLLPDLGTGGDFTMTVKSDTYKDAGTYADAITINAVTGGNYVGSKVVDFIISGGTSMNDAKITVVVEPVVYNGSNFDFTDPTIKAKVVVKNDGALLTEGTHYTLTALTTDNKNANTYANDLVITGMGQYYGTRTADFIVEPKDFQLCSIVASAAYSGSEFPKADIEANTPTVYVIVKDGATTLTVATDYTIEAQDPTTYPTGTPWGAYKDAGTYANAITVTAVTGGNYTGHQTVDFVIEHAGFDVSSALIVAKDIYTGAALPPKASNPAEASDNIIVTLGGKTLTYGTEYTFIKAETDDKYVDAKTYENAITIKGAGEYYGEVTGSYVIQPRAFADVDVTITVPDLNYDATDQAPVPEVKYQTNVIPVANYTFTPATVKEAGTYTLNFEGQYSLTGTKTAEVKVLKALDGTYTDDFVITIVPDQPLPYDGVNPVEPEIKVTDNGKELVEGTDYTVAYSDNTGEGEGTVTITGAGVYSGTKTLKFPIVAEFFTEGDFSYHYISSTTVAVGTAAHDAATTPPANGQVVVPDKVTHTIGTTPYDFDVIGVEAGAFKALTTMLTLTLPATIEYIEDKAFEGCTALRWIDASTATALVPSSLDRTIEATPFYGVPAQALVFLTDNKVEGENYIYLVGVGDFRCDVFKIFDDVSGKQTNFTQAEGYQWAYENPYDFKANSVVNTRQLTAEQHFTTCLPYSMAIPANMKAYQLTASTDPSINTASTLIGFNEVTGTLEAFKPYVLIPSASGQLLCAGETDIPTTVGVYTDADAHYLNKTPAAATAGGYVMYGTMRFRDGDGKQYIMQEKNEWKLTDTNPGWNGGTDPCILPMRAYIAKEGDYPVKPFLNAQYTNLSELDELFDEAVNNGEVRYDLAGRKVSGNLRKGIYIVNGKKTVMGK